MKKSGIVVAGLLLLVASVSAKANESPTRTWRITVGNVVTMLQLPDWKEQSTSKPAFIAKVIRVSDTSIVLNGAASIRIGQQAFTASAGQITVQLQDKKSVRSFSLQGGVVFKIRQNNGQVMQITADSAVLEPV